MRTILPIFLLLLIAGLCAAHFLGRKLERRKPRLLQEIVEPRQVKAEEAYAALFDAGLEEFKGWQVQRYSSEEYKRR